jgi:hypothetical protein
MRLEKDGIRRARSIDALAYQLRIVGKRGPRARKALKIWRVDNKVGNVKNTGPELILPVEEPLL